MHIAMARDIYPISFLHIRYRFYEYPVATQISLQTLQVPLQATAGVALMPLLCSFDTFPIDCASTCHGFRCQLFGLQRQQPALRNWLHTMSNESNSPAQCTSLACGHTKNKDRQFNQQAGRHPHAPYSPSCNASLALIAAGNCHPFYRNSTECNSLPQVFLIKAQSIESG